MQDGASDMGPGKRRKGGALVRTVELGGADQAQHPHLLEILGRRWAAAGVMQRQGTHQLAVAFHQLVSLAQLAGGAGCGKGSAGHGDKRGDGEGKRKGI